MLAGEADAILEELGVLDVVVERARAMPPLTEAQRARLREVWARSGWDQPAAEADSAA